MFKQRCNQEHTLPGLHSVCLISSGSCCWHSPTVLFTVTTHEYWRECFQCESLKLVDRVSQITAAISESEYSSLQQLSQDAMVIYALCVSSACKQLIAFLFCSGWWYLSCLSPYLHHWGVHKAWTDSPPSWILWIRPLSLLRMVMFRSLPRSVSAFSCVLEDVLLLDGWLCVAYQIYHWHSGGAAKFNLWSKSLSLPG